MRFSETHVAPTSEIRTLTKPGACAEKKQTIPQCTEARAEEVYEHRKGQRGGSVEAGKVHEVWYLCRKDGLYEKLMYRCERQKSTEKCPKRGACAEIVPRLACLRWGYKIKWDCNRFLEMLYRLL